MDQESSPSISLEQQRAVLTNLLRSHLEQKIKERYPSLAKNGVDTYSFLWKMTDETLLSYLDPAIDSIAAMAEEDASGR